MMQFNYFVDCLSEKAPLAGKKKTRIARSTDAEEHEQGATKCLKYGKGIG